jgi:hypothetical protein
LLRTYAAYPRTGLVALRGLSARQENRIAMVVAIGGASCTALSQALMSCIQKPTTALMRRGSTAKRPSPDSPPRSLAKTSGPWRKLAEMNGSRFDCFNERLWPHQDAEGDLHDRTCNKDTKEQSFNDGLVVAIMRITDLKAWMSEGRELP